MGGSSVTAPSGSSPHQQGRHSTGLASRLGGGGEFSVGSHGSSCGLSAGATRSPPDVKQATRRTFRPRRPWQSLRMVAAGYAAITVLVVVIVQLTAGAFRFRR